MNGFRYVDLGLSSGTLWANQNLPGYYAFGEYEEKFIYTKENSITFGKDKLQLIDENLCNGKGNCISKHSYIAPTKEQFLELMDECDWEWGKDSNGNLGYKVTSKTHKENNEYTFIFLPVEGYKLQTDVVDKGIWGNYWTSTIIDGKYHAAYLYFFKNAIYWGNHSERFYGRSVRPVINTKCNALIDVNLPSKTLWDSKNFGANNPFETGQIISYGEPWGKDPKLYDITHYRYAVKDAVSQHWRYRFFGDEADSSMWDFVENYRGEKVKCFKEYPKYDWVVNTTDLQEPSKADFEELIANIEEIQLIRYVGRYFYLFYFKNSYEVLIFSYGRRIFDYPDEENPSSCIEQWYYWTNELIYDPAKNIANSAYVFHISNNTATIEISNGDHHAHGLVQGMQLRRIKKQ